MGFFASLFGGYSEDAYGSSTTRNAIVSVSEPAAEAQTGVERYLENQPAGLSSVEKYLKAQEVNQPSGVAKYLARQAIAARNKPVVVLSGVDKYLKNNEGSAPVVMKRTGVEKYLSMQENVPVSRVAKYVLQKTIDERNAPAKPKATRVESYLQSLPETTTSRVSKYLARQAVASAAQQTKEEVAAVVEAIVNDVALTGVEKYLKAQNG
jgi:hypothetical protein